MPEQSIRWSLDLARFDSATRAKIISILNRMDQELMAKLGSANLTEWGQARIDTLLAQSKQVIATHHGAAQAALAAQLEGLVGPAGNSALKSLAPKVVVTLSGPDAARDLKLVSINVPKFDSVFAKDTGFYVGPNGEGGISGRYDRVSKFILDNQAMEASTVSVAADGSVGFDNGRHRYAAMRDAGIKQLPVAMDLESIRNAKAAGLLAPEHSPVVEISVATSLPTEAVMRALVGDSIIMGSTQAEWWAKQSADTTFRFVTAVRQGVTAAETNQQIIRRVRGELDITRRNAASLVQTSVQTVANDARLATFKANADVVSGLRWLATLDRHTCARCGARDGQTWKVDGTPLTADTPFLNPPLHFNDRCVLAPMTRFSNMGSGQRASDQGPVDRKITFDDFLSKQTEAYQNDVLGKGRADMWRKGHITLSDLTSGTGRPLTLEQLRAKYG